MKFVLNHKSWRKIKINILPRKALIVSIATVSSLIIAGVVLMLSKIYTQDKPSFIPKETRGEIREGIRENVAKPLAAVIPAVGNPFFNAAFNYKNNDAFTNSNNFEGGEGNGYSGWETYRNEGLRFEIKYPESYTLKENKSEESTSFVFKDKNAPDNMPPAFSLEMGKTLLLNESAWIAERERGNDLIMNTPEKVGITGTDWYKVLEAGDPDHYLYININNDNIYIFICALEFGEIENVIKSLKTF